jgi:imidazoleglycerol-phosphate dehydratase
MTEITRETRETRVRVSLECGEGRTTISTTIPFLDHMMIALGRYAGFDLAIDASGDLRHHVLEDVAITVGAAVARTTPASAARYGDRTVPMDDALVHVAVDLGGRSYYRGPLPGTLYDHWMRSFAEHAKLTLHVRVLRGRDRHHIVEAAFKALGLALRDAFRTDGSAETFSTKGTVRWSEGR